MKTPPCPTCGTMTMGGWCPVCHPNPEMMGQYKWTAIGQLLKSIGCLLMLVPVIIIMLVGLWSCAVS